MDRDFRTADTPEQWRGFRTADTPEGRRSGAAGGYVRPTIPPDERLKALEDAVAGLGESLRALGGDGGLLYGYVAQMQAISAVMAGHVVAMQTVARDVLDTATSINMALSRLNRGYLEPDAPLEPS